MHPVDLLGTVLRATIHRAGISPGAIEDLLVGCVSQMGDQSYNVARQAWLASGQPIEVPPASLNMMCGSSQRAAQLADALIRSGTHDLVLVGGVESMSRKPIGADQNLPEGAIGPYPASYLERFESTSQGGAAERVADR